MSWKNLKVWFGIEHMVSVSDGKTCIGSPYIVDLIVIGANGEVVKRYEHGNNAELTALQAAFDADPEKVRLALTTPDRFAATLPVYTYAGGEILQDECEAYGWPNVTHRGAIMFTNSHSPNKGEVVGWAKANAKAGMKFRRDRIVELEAALREQRKLLSSDEADLAKLNADYPPPDLRCPFCGVELDDQTGRVLASGEREWMCNVCGETGLVEEPVTAPPADRPPHGPTDTSSATPAQP